MDPIQSLDWGTYYWFRTQRHEGELDLGPIMRILNALANELVLVVIALAVLGLLLQQRKHRAALVFLGSIALAVGAAHGIASLVNRPWPLAAEGDSMVAS